MLTKVLRDESYVNFLDFYTFLSSSCVICSPEFNVIAQKLTFRLLQFVLQIDWSGCFSCIEY